jgi:hypothetical protein
MGVNSHQQKVWAVRPKMRSPGRPPVWQRE